MLNPLLLAMNPNLTQEQIHKLMRDDADRKVALMRQWTDGVKAAVDAAPQDRKNEVMSAALNTFSRLMPFFL